MDSMTYTVGKSRITLLFGNITTSQAEVIVSSDDFLLSMGGGVSASILDSAGPLLAADARKLIPLRVADVAVSTAGYLPAKYVMHAVTLGPGADEIARGAVVRRVTQRVLQLAAGLGCTSIAFPSIGAGVARIPFRVVASEMAGALVDFLLESEHAFDVELYFMEKHLAREDDLFPFFEAFAGRTRALWATESPGGTVLSPPPGADDPSTPASSAEAARQRQVYEMLRRLDARRDELEAELFDVLTLDDRGAAHDMARVREQLEQITSLRAMYESEVQHAGAEGDAPVDDSVFVSSTSDDLKEHRAAVRSKVEGLRLKFIGMEEFLADGESPAKVICEKVDNSKVYVGILGWRYGSLDDTTGLSMTETEYRRARSTDKPVRMFLMKDDAPITFQMTEQDPDKMAKLKSLRSEVMKEHVCCMFRTVEDLVQQVEASLRDTFQC